MNPFDAATFLETSVDEANDTKLIPVPVGEYTAVVEKIKADTWQGRKDPSMHGVKLFVTWMIDDQNVKALLNRDKVTITQDVMLDTLPNGGLDMSKGKNISLGRLREALGLNVPGQPFKFSDLNGRVATIRVINEPYEGEMYAKIKEVAKTA